MVGGVNRNEPQLWHQDTLLEVARPFACELGVHVICHSLAGIATSGQAVLKGHDRQADRSVSGR